MSQMRYPNESREYRDARDSLLKDEQQLVEKIKSVAERRRSLPRGGELKEDYGPAMSVFHKINAMGLTP